MSPEAVRKIADAVLYEGYMLYPYRPSSIKNRQRWTFGGLYPDAYAPTTGDRSSLQAQVLARATASTRFSIQVRFLHLLSETKSGQAWQIGVEREIVVSGIEPESRRLESFHFSASASADGRQEEVSGTIALTAAGIQQGVQQITVRVANATESPISPISREEASMHALIATHAILHVTEGAFISLTDPPEDLLAAASQCVNEGVWPVLAGESGTAEWMLASPIILYDYPQIAPESPGDLFDGTEIDEILTLRVLTMTDAEKEEMRRSDPRLRAMLDRTEALSEEEMWKLHGALRDPHGLSKRTGGAI